MRLTIDDAEAPDAGARMRAIMAQHFDFVWRTTRRLGLRDFEADDASQRAFIVVSRRLHEIHPGSERSFLFAVALRIVAEIRRTHARRGEVADDAADDRRDPAPLPDELVERRRARELLDEVIAAMPEDVRPVFVLFELEQMTMAEVASLLGIPAGTVASRLRRAREIFEKKIAAAGAARERRRG
jgi:RNA polymerase sigma-70 factor, ECF subfamily